MLLISNHTILGSSLSYSFCSFSNPQHKSDRTKNYTWSDSSTTVYYNWCLQSLRYRTISTNISKQFSTISWYETPYKTHLY